MALFFSADNLKTLLQKNPDSLIFAHMASRYIDEGEHQKAIDLCQKGVEKFPEYAFGHFILGTALYYTKKYTDAKRALEKAVAYDPINPRAWEVLSAINEILNLNEEAQESNLQVYLLDFFNKDIPPEFITDRDNLSPQTAVPVPDITEISEMESLTEAPAASPEVNVDHILDEVVSGGNEELNFEKALEDVFQGTEEKKVSPDQIPTPPESISEDLKEIPTGTEGAVLSADEFTSAIESFFSSYDEENKSDLDTLVAPETSPDSGELADQSELPETAPQAEFGSEGLISQPGVTGIVEEASGELEELSVDSERLSDTFSAPDMEVTSPQSAGVSETEIQEPEQIFTVPASAEKTPEDELLDFKAFVSDVIRDAEESTVEEMPPDDSPQAISDSADDTVQIPESGIVLDPSQPIPEATEEFLREEDFNLPGESAAQIKDATATAPGDSIPDMPDAAKKPAAGNKTARFSRPPILSPTLGEIYIAQGRFEEAIDIFKQLLEKDPQNSRFRRKIEDLHKLLMKKKSGSA